MTPSDFLWVRSASDFEGLSLLNYACWPGRWPTW